MTYKKFFIFFDLFGYNKNVNKTAASAGKKELFAEAEVQQQVFKPPLMR
jgi:hypothetical protein